MLLRRTEPESPMGTTHAGIIRTFEFIEPKEYEAIKKAYTRERKVWIRLPEREGGLDPNLNIHGTIRTARKKVGPS